MDLFYQSIHSPDRPIINLNNPGIKRAADLIDYTKLTPQQLAEAKNREQNAVIKSIYRQEVHLEVVLNAINEGFEDPIIAKLTGLSVEEIQQIRAENRI